MPSYDNKVLTGDQLVYFSGLVKTALASKADSSALAGKQDALVFNTAYNASSNKVATMSDVNTVANANVDISKIVIEDEEADEPILFADFLESDVLYPLDNLCLRRGDNIDIQDIVVETISGENDEPVYTYLPTTLSNMNSAIANKQDELVFNTAYNAVSNKVATMSDITTALGGISSFSFEIVQALPQSDISTSKIYLVAKASSGTNQVYTEYAYVNNAWEIIGDTSMSIDTLSNAEVATIWSTATATT